MGRREVTLIVVVRVRKLTKGSYEVCVRSDREGPSERSSSRLREESRISEPRTIRACCEAHYHSPLHVPPMEESPATCCWCRWVFSDVLATLLTVSDVM